jgi:hypothetical protein
VTSSGLDRIERDQQEGARASEQSGALFYCYIAPGNPFYSNVFERNDMFPGARFAPPEYQAILIKYGRNLLGENIFRLIWLPSRCYWAGGWWEIEGEFGYKRQPKYGVKNQRWAIEKWLPPSTYGSPQMWDQSTASREGYLQVGPFPARGEYECAAVFSVGQGPAGYVPLEPGTVDLQARLIYNGRSRSLWDIRNALRSDQEMESRRKDREFDEMWDSVQHSRKGITLGPSGHYSEENAINEYKQRLLARQDAWVAQADFQKGFAQTEEENAS